MRWSSTLPFAAALSAALHVAAAPGVGARAPAPSVSATYNKRRRAFMDECAAVTVKVGDASMAHSGQDVDACLCLSQVPQFVESNPLLQSLAWSGLSTEQLELDFSTAIQDSPSNHLCTYPNHAAPACTAANPCAFECAAPFEASPSLTRGLECACPRGLMECDGDCVRPGLAGTCPTKAGEKVEAVCPKGLSVCAVPNAGKDVWECVDTSADLWSCGGCTLPFDTTAPQGEDCTSIAHANAVACVAGQCLVSTCASGFAPTASNGSCVASLAQAVKSPEKPHVHVEVQVEVDAPADAEPQSMASYILSGLEYGLEHVLPLPIHF